MGLDLNWVKKGGLLIQLPQLFKKIIYDMQNVCCRHMKANSAGTKMAD